MGVEEGGGRRWWRRRGKAVECDIEAELESSALEREGSGMVRMRTDASAAKEGGGRGGGVEESGGDMKRSNLSMATAASEVKRVFENGGRLGCEGLLDCASSSAHHSITKTPTTLMKSFRSSILSFYIFFLLCS